MKNLSFMVAAILVLASAPKVLMAAPAAMAEQTATEDVVDYTIDWTKQGGLQYVGCSKRDRSQFKRLYFCIC